MSLLLCRPAGALLGLLLVAFVAAPVSAASWRPVVQLATSGHLAGSDSVAASGGTVHLIYTRSGVAYQRSTNGGATFGSPVRLRASSPTTATYTALSVSSYGKTVSVLYARVAVGSDVRTLHLLTSLDGGITWEPIVAIATGRSTTRAGDGAVALSSGGAYVAWTEPSTGEIRMRRNVVPGRGFEPAFTIGRTTSRDVQNIGSSLRGDVALAASSNRIAVFWAPDGIAEGTVGHIVARRSADSAGTFGREDAVASNASVVVGARPAAVSVFSTTILLAYQRSDGRDVVLRSANAGASWSTFVVSPAPTAAGNPVIQDVFVGYGGVARLVYASYSANGSIDRLWMRSSTDGGAHWGSASEVVGSNPTKKSHANVVGTTGGVLLAFERFAAPSGGISVRAYR